MGVWNHRYPCWDEQLTATSSHTFHQLGSKLCETALKKRRCSGDSGIDNHLWKLKLSSEEQACETNALRRELDSDDDDSDDDSETKYHGRHLVAPDQHRQMYQDVNEYQFVPSSEALSRGMLPKGHVVTVTYDFGSTTVLYLKVLNIRPVGARSLMQYFEMVGHDEEAEARELEAVPAYQLSKGQQIDSYYPNFSKAFLGRYVPLYQDNEERRLPASAGSATMGLSSRIRQDDDTTFCTIENANSSCDLFYSSQPFSDMNEFLQVAEQAWTPRSPEQDPDRLDRYRYDMVCRHVFPSSAKADPIYNHMLQVSKSEYAQYGPKLLFFRLTDKKEILFDFAKAFPKTNAQFESGKFRWFKYKNDVLRILVGRGVGYDNRDFDSGQVLRTWKRSFSSLHELLCAVEASWTFQKKPLEADTILEEYDWNLGPSKPGPKEPELLGKKDDAVVVTTCSDANKFVTVMAISQEETTVLYSGHADGTLTKWCLAEDKQLWSKQIYPNGTKDFPHYNEHIGIHLRGTAGVAGLVVRKRGKKHLVYTWTDAYEGYPETECWKDRGPSKVKCWSGKDGRYLRSYACDVGMSDKGEAAHPSIATVVFCRLWIEDDDKWVDSIVVGLHALCARTLDWKGDYSRFDLDEAQRVGEGNILPFYEYSQGRPMETWREHGGLIRAMAVIEDKYLLSYSIQVGHGIPDAMVLWSLEEPGVPLCRHDFWDPSESLHDQTLTRLDSVVGISVSGTDVLLACEEGDRIAVFTVRDDDEYPILELKGYGNIGNRRFEEDGLFHGCMAMSGQNAVMANEGFGDTWLFNIEDSANSESLDEREGNPYDYYNEGRADDDDDDEASKSCYSGREIAIGKVFFPLFGANPPRRKKRKLWGESGFKTPRKSTLKAKL